ncbi:uncharacterized protein LOC128192128 [Crassostrea angulata]|uniref:uncharacterized protein LOC128192128 n=1 Tax=Magallana angulata TaxID=2784310 RepID=UPI0022B1B5A1|nr:uncharacterized protein LOC128192128 [Crassostrea angulata]
MDAVQKIRESSTALEAKRIGHTVKDPVGWNEERETVMEEVIMLKADQVKGFRAKLEIADPKSVFAEATFDTFWGTGLDVTGTKGTNPSKWPGDNKLGLTVKRVATAKCGRRLWSVSVPRKGSPNEDNQTNLDKFIREARKDAGKKGAKT